MVRRRRRGGAGGGGDGLTTGSPGADALLRPVLQLALDVARAGQESFPAVDAPRVLRPLLRFAKLPDRALAVVRRSLDEDGDFRARVAAVATEGAVGRAGVLFLSRPEGWSDELGALARVARLDATADLEQREDRSARRRVSHAEQAAVRAEEAAARARSEASRAASELAQERRERRVAEEEVARLRRRAAALEAERDAAVGRAAEAADEAERRRREVADLTARLGRAAAPPPPPAAPGADVAAAARAVGAAAEAAATLGRALSAAAAALAPPPAAEPAPAPAGPSPSGPSPRRRRVPPRRPAPLPPAVLDDSPEAAAHLVRVPGALLLVDGYNAAKLLWPAVSAVELRERLVDALSELEARSAADIHVVFDGADVPPPPPRAGGRRPVRVSFSPPEVEADDVILALVDGEPPARTVVVASSDRRVRDGARARGANVISGAQLAAVLHRS